MRFKNYLFMTLIVLISFSIAGCKTTGYLVRVKTDSIEYGEIQRIEAMLLEKGYKLTSKEKLRYDGSLPNDVRISFEKQFIDKSGNGEWWLHIVFINLLYIKDPSNNIAQNLDAYIYNHHVALIVPEIKTEIDSIGDSLYEDIATKVGKKKVSIERKEWGPPTIY